MPSSEQLCSIISFLFTEAPSNVTPSSSIILNTWLVNFVKIPCEKMLLIFVLYDVWNFIYKRNKCAICHCFDSNGNFSTMILF